MHYEASKEKYQGVFMAAPTPMKNDESLDLARLAELIRYYRDHGLVNGHCVCTLLGAGGEAMHLDEAERRQVAETAVEAAEGQIPIFVGVGHTRTRTAIALARHADRVGVDGLQLELPYYFDATPDDAFEFIRAVAEAVACGIALYNTPWTSGLDMDADLLGRVCDACPNVVGLKWYTGSLYAWFRVIEEFGERLSITINMPSSAAPSAFLLGARGYVSQAVSAAPRQNVQIVEWLRAGAYDRAMKWIRIVEDGYYQILADAAGLGYSGEGNFIKAAMDAAGFPCGPARLPNRPMPDEIRARFAAWATRVADLLNS